MLLFFAPVLRISRTDDRAQANKAERKRTLPIQAKFVLAKNTHYFAHFQHNGFGDALLARNYCAYNGMAFMARNTRYDADDFGVSLLRIW